jgi:hypothetical protein
MTHILHSTALFGVLGIVLVLVVVPDVELCMSLSLLGVLARWA